MKIYKYSLLLAVLFSTFTLSAQNEDFRKTAPESLPAKPIKMGESNSFTLDNGLQVIVVQNHKIPKISYKLFIDIPSVFEGDKMGYTSIMGSLIKQGATTMSKAEIDEEVDMLGARYYTSASGFFASSLRKHSDQLMQMVASTFFNPTFPQAEFDRSIKQTLSGLSTQKDDPRAMSSNISSVMTYGKNHPYGELETEETVKNITRQDCIDFYNKYFKPNISYLIIVGDITLEEAKQKSEMYFGSWKADKSLSFEKIAKPTAPTNRRVVFVPKSEAVQSIIKFVYPVDLEPADEDNLNAIVMNKILGSGSVSTRLNANLREDKGYTYGAYSRLRASKEIGSFSAGASVRNDVTVESIKEFLHEFNTLRDTLVPMDELKSTKAVYAGRFAQGLEKPETVAQYALNIKRNGLDAEHYNTFLQRLEKVDAASIQKAARKFIKPNEVIITVVGDPSLVDSLKQFTTSGEVEIMDMYGNEIKE